MAIFIFLSFFLSLGSNQYKKLVVRSKKKIKLLDANSKHGKVRFPMYGLPNHALCLKLTESKFQYISAEIGSAILQYSKLIFFDAIYHILKHLDPLKGQYLYSGTVLTIRLSCVGLKMGEKVGGGCLKDFTYFLFLQNIFRYRFVSYCYSGTNFRSVYITQSKAILGQFLFKIF